MSLFPMTVTEKMDTNGCHNQCVPSLDALDAYIESCIQDDQWAKMLSSRSASFLSVSTSSEDVGNEGDDVATPLPVRRHPSPIERLHHVGPIMKKFSKSRSWSGFTSVAVPY